MVTNQVSVRSQSSLFALSVTEMELLPAASQNFAKMPLKGWIRFSIIIDLILSKVQGLVKGSSNNTFHELGM